MDFMVPNHIADKLKAFKASNHVGLQAKMLFAGATIYLAIPYDFEHTDDLKDRITQWALDNKLEFLGSVVQQELTCQYFSNNGTSGPPGHYMIADFALYFVIEADDSQQTAFKLAFGEELK